MVGSNSESGDGGSSGGSDGHRSVGHSSEVMAANTSVSMQVKQARAKNVH